jgi:hypothetical protein
MEKRLRVEGGKNETQNWSVIQLGIRTLGLSDFKTRLISKFLGFCSWFAWSFALRRSGQGPVVIRIPERKQSSRLFHYTDGKNNIGYVGYPMPYLEYINLTSMVQCSVNNWPYYTLITSLSRLWRLCQRSQYSSKYPFSTSWSSEPGVSSQTGIARSATSSLTYVPRLQRLALRHWPRLILLIGTVGDNFAVMPTRIITKGVLYTVPRKKVAGWASSG